MALVTPSKAVLALNSSSEFREKALQIIQYVCKLLTACNLGSSVVTGLTNSTAGARRMMKLFAWMKLFENFKAADAASGPLRRLLYAQVMLAISVETMRDVVTFDKLGLFKAPPGPGKWTFAKLNEAVDACLAAVGIAIAVVRIRSALADEQLTALRTSLFKSLCHLGKACDAGKLGGGPGDRIGALCGLLNTLLAARDLRVKLVAKHK